MKHRKYTPPSEDDEEEELLRKKRLKVHGKQAARLGRKRRRDDGGPVKGTWKTKVDPWSAQTIGPENFETSGARKAFEGKDVLEREDMTTDFNPNRKSWT